MKSVTDTALQAAIDIMNDPNGSLERGINIARTIDSSMRRERQITNQLICALEEIEEYANRKVWTETELIGVRMTVAGIARKALDQVPS